MVMDSLHVIKQVVPPGKAIARDATLTSWVVAQVRPVTVSVHSMSLSFMTQETGSGRELLLGACVDLAPEGLQMGVDEFAAVRKGGQPAYSM